MGVAMAQGYDAHQNAQLSQLARQKVLEQPVLLHEALIRNNLHVPSIKSEVATHKFLLECRDKKVFLFAQDDIRHKVVPQ